MSNAEETVILETVEDEELLKETGLSSVLKLSLKEAITLLLESSCKLETVSSVGVVLPISIRSPVL